MSARRRSRASPPGPTIGLLPLLNLALALPRLGPGRRHARREPAAGGRDCWSTAPSATARRSATRSTTPPTSSSPGSPWRSPSMPGCSTSAARGRPTWAGSGVGLVGIYLGWLPGVARASRSRSLAAALFGGVWGLIPGWLQARRGSHVVITTIMLNFVAAALMTYLLVNVLIKPGQHAPESVDLPGDASGCRSCTSLLGLLGVDLGHCAAQPLVRPGAASAASASGCSSGETRSATSCASSARARPPRSMAASRPPRAIILAMTLSGALAGLMALNEILGAQHRLILGFTGGYGFVGIAVALMGRNHPVGIVLAALLFGALYQGGSELAFDMPRDQPRHGRGDPGPGHPVRRRARSTCSGRWLEALFARRRARPVPGMMLSERRIPGPPAAGQHDPAGGAARAGGAGRAVLRARGRRRHRARGQDAGRGLRRRRGGRRPPARAWLGLLAGDGVRRRASPWSTASPASPIAATRSSRAWRSTSSWPGLGPTLADAWFRQARPRAAHRRAARASRPIDLPLADAVWRECPILGPIYAEVISGHNILVYVAALVGAAGRLGALPHALRAAPARGRREPGAVDTAGISVDGHALPGADGDRRCCAASPAPTCRSPRTPASCAT